MTPAPEHYQATTYNPGAAGYGAIVGGRPDLDQVPQTRRELVPMSPSGQVEQRQTGETPIGRAIMRTATVAVMAGGNAAFARGAMDAANDRRYAAIPFTRRRREADADYFRHRETYLGWYYAEQASLRGVYTLAMAGNLCDLGGW